MDQQIFLNDDYSKYLKPYKLEAKKFYSSTVAELISKNEVRLNPPTHMTPRALFHVSHKIRFVEQVEYITPVVGERAP